MKPATAVIIHTLRALAERAIKGPVFIDHDENGAEALAAFHAHADSGLAKLDTGRVGDWDVVKFAEWPTARYIMELYNSTPELIDAILEAERENLQLKAALEKHKQAIKTVVSMQSMATFSRHCIPLLKDSLDTSLATRDAEVLERKANDADVQVKGLSQEGGIALSMFAQQLRDEANELRRMADEIEKGKP